MAVNSVEIDLLPTSKTDNDNTSDLDDGDAVSSKQNTKKAMKNHIKTNELEQTNDKDSKVEETPFWAELKFTANGQKREKSLVQYVYFITLKMCNFVMDIIIY
ncbi:uncharacterized protein LOC144345452 [Saccoglossus kowalevskii]